MIHSSLDNCKFNSFWAVVVLLTQIFHGVKLGHQTMQTQQHSRVESGQPTAVEPTNSSCRQEQLHCDRAHSVPALTTLGGATGA